MRYPSNAVGAISDSHPSSSTLIINVWAKAMSVACQNLLSQQHLIEVDITKDGNLGDKWITGTTSDDVGKMQPVKVSATQIFYNFNKLACPYSNLPKTMKGSEIKKIPSADSILPPSGDDQMH
eukprot:12716313-Ditylum_brightwellii.AAC.1